MTTKEKILELLNKDDTRADIIEAMRDAEEQSILNPFENYAVGFSAEHVDGCWEANVTVQKVDNAPAVGEDFEIQGEYYKYLAVSVLRWENTIRETVEMLWNDYSDGSMTMEEAMESEDNYKAWYMRACSDTFRGELDTSEEEDMIDKFIEAISAREDPEKDFVSEIFYTGGGIWCGVIAMGDGTYFAGELNDYGDIYYTLGAAHDPYGEDSDDFVRYTDADDKDMLLEMWRKAILREMETGLSGYVDGWLEEWKECAARHAMASEEDEEE